LERLKTTPIEDAGVAGGQNNKATKTDEIERDKRLEVSGLEWLVTTPVVYAWPHFQVPERIDFRVYSRMVALACRAS
jgi:hypothetical protein